MYCIDMVEELFKSYLLYYIITCNETFLPPSRFPFHCKCFHNTSALSAVFLAVNKIKFDSYLIQLAHPPLILLQALRHPIFPFDSTDDNHLPG